MYAIRSYYVYVAITRARQVFIASGCESSKERGETPYRRLQAALEKLDVELAYGDDLPTVAVVAEDLPVAFDGVASPPMPAVGVKGPSVPRARLLAAALLLAALPRIAGCVITSYSIHYTKLYDSA